MPGCGENDDAPSSSTDGYASWAASPQDYAELFPVPGVPAPEPQAFEDQTLRQLVRLSAGGDEVRVQLSNLFGTAPVTFDAVGIALGQGGGAIDAESHVALTFGGSSTVTLDVGAERWSDSVAFPVESGAELAVSLHVGSSAEVGTVHSLGQQTAYLVPGNAVSAGTLPAGETRQSYYWLSRVDVRGPSLPRVLVTFGDSITDGFNSTPDENHRYPNYLSDRLAAAAANVSVVNAGISGNRVLNDVVGPSATSRFTRDVVGLTGASDVIILIGINDIGFGGIAPAQEVSAAQITDGLSQMVAAGKTGGLRVFLATLTPFQGTMPPYYSEASEAKRQAVNDWIRANGEVAGVVDFDQIMSNPNDPLAMRPELDSGDHLHPNDAGYATMADAIDVTWFE